MPSITIWSRLEPRCRNNDFSAALEARVFDPLWMLARQWQLGEMLGNDAGSPITAAVTATAAPIDRFAAGSAAAAAPLPSALPLEAAIECEGIRPAGDVVDYGQAAEAGLAFIRMLRTAGLDSYAVAYVAAYPIALPAADALAALDAPAARTLRIVAGRVPDGVKLASDLRSANGKLPATPALAAADVTAVSAVAARYLAWYDDLFDEPEALGNASAPAESPAWDETHMEYAFALDASTSDVPGAFAARRYDGAALSWTSFDRTAAALGTQSAAVAEESRTFVPSPVTYKGMPARRFWEFDDANVDYGNIEAGPADLGRLMLREFASIYGNDWFVIPLTLPARSIARITSLTVRDTFGVATTVPHYAQTADGGRWRMFCVTGDTEPHRLLLVAPSARGSESDPIERVVLMRDEAAMMAWGVERIVAGASGKPADRSGESAEPPAIAQGGPGLTYRLGTPIPSPYIPYVAGTSDGKPRMLRAAFRASQTSNSLVSPRGRILAAGNEIFQEEFPREGASIERRYRLVRSSDGGTHLWMSRRKRVGASAPAPGLAFDQLLES